MESNLPSPPHDTNTKNAFRKPSGDAANRNYRRRSPVEGSPLSDGSPKREHSSSPNPSREDSVRTSDHHSRKYEGREQDRHYGRSHHGRSSDSFRHSDRQSSKSYHGHPRHEEYIKHNKYVDEDRCRERLSSRSGHGSRGDHTREEKESDSRSKDYQRGVDKHPRDKYDRSDYRSKEKDREKSLEHEKYKDRDFSYDRSGSGKRHAPYDEVERERHTRDRDGRDERRDSRRSDWAVSYSESRSQKDYSGSRRDSSKYRIKEAYKNEQKEQDDQKLPLEEKRKHDESEIVRDKERNTGKVGEQFGNEDKESYGKKPKLFGVDKEDNYRKDDERQTSGSKLAHDSQADLGAVPTSGLGGTDIDAAKVAAMKAAELVNRNLVGVGAGCLTTDQKKKLLWGHKKSTTSEESGHRWDTAMFSDRERQEKFNKLMSLRLYWCLWQTVGCERRNQGGAELRQRNWHRSTPCREAEGTPAGSRETVHCRPSSTRWPYSWFGSLSIHLGKFASSYISNAFEYHAPMPRRTLLLVCFRHFWEFMLMYALMLVASSLDGWWEFHVRQERVIATESLIMIVSKILFLCSSYETRLVNHRNSSCFLDVSFLTST